MVAATARVGRPKPDVPERRSQADRRSASEAALLRAAAELVAEYGIEQATLARIGERAGLSRTLATYHFGSKDVLVEKLAQRAQDRITEATEQALAAIGLELEDIPAMDRLRALVNAQLRLFESPEPEDRAFVVLWAASFPSRSAVDGMRHADRRTYDGWSVLIGLGQRDGSIRTDVDPSAAAMWLVGLTRGVAAVLATHPGLDVARLVRPTCDTLLTDALSSLRHPGRTEQPRAGRRSGQKASRPSPDDPSTGRLTTTFT